MLFDKDERGIGTPAAKEPRLEATPMTALTENANVLRPVLLVAHPNAQYTEMVCRHFGRRGWVTEQAGSGKDVRARVRELAPAVIVLATDLPDESGWLICNKLIQENPDQRVILVARHWTAENRHFADFVKAAGLVHEEAGIQALAEAIEDPAPVFSMS
jgi:DNA-binding NarL/FixJ family response regulator